MTPSVEIFNTAVQQHTFNDDPLLDLSNNSDEAAPPSEANQNITKPGEHDVLLGRGGGTNNHSGNIKFRKLVNEHKMRYLACSKVDKPKVAREVVQLWRKMNPPGRFLARKDETKRGPGSIKSADNVWFEVGDKKAREKASQCLRERTPDVMPYIKHLREQQDAITEQGVSMVQKQLQMRQQEGHGHPHTMSQQQQQQQYQDYNSPATNRNTLNVQAQAFRQQRMLSDPALMTQTTSPQPQYANNGMPYDARAKMAAAGIGHPHVAAAAQNVAPYQLQHQHSQQPSLHNSMGSLGHASVSSHGAPQAVTAAELYGDEDFYGQQQQQQQPQQQPSQVRVAGDMAEVEYQRNMMMMQQQVHMQQMQMRRMQQQRMQRMQQQQLQQQQAAMHQQQALQQQHQQQQLMQQQQQAAAAVSAASLFQAPNEAEPYAVQSDPLFVDLESETHVEPEQAEQPQEPPQQHQQQQHQPRSALKQKRGREAPEERVAPDRAPTSTSLMSINTTPDGGEITIEEYRKQLEEYIENNQIQSALENNTDDDDDDDCPSDLEDDWEKEREKNMQRQQQERKRGVNRNVSGCSFMSAKTTKSNLSMVSGISAGMFSEADTEDTRENMKSTRSLCSSLSLMSELTDLSENIDNLGLDD